MRAWVAIFFGLLVPACLLAAEETTGAEAAVIVPPKPIASTVKEESDIGRCYASSARRQGAVGRVMVQATVGTDGRIRSHELTPGVEPWQAKTAECVMPLLRFEPAMKDGSPTEAVVSLPLVFSFRGSDPVTLPTMTTPAPEIEEIYRACYPPDQLAIAEPRYRVALSRAGKARKIEIVESTGLESLDQAGVCVLERLQFEPARHNNVAIETSAIIPIRLRPPK